MYLLTSGRNVKPALPLESLFWELMHVIAVVESRED